MLSHTDQVVDFTILDTLRNMKPSFPQHTVISLNSMFPNRGLVSFVLMHCFSWLLQIGIILSSLGVLTLSTFDFLQIVELLNIVYCLAELMEFAAFLYLRYKAPNLFRCDTLSAFDQQPHCAFLANTL